MTGRRVAIGVFLMVVLGGATFWACGGNDGDRDKKVCRSCEAGVEHDCFNECRELCVPDDPNCDTRCAGQCDECRRDLVCGACQGECTGTTLRCAPTNETVQCDDGTFGGVPATAPTPSS
jgi:hypothetical protein